ncbi:MAG: radical SAM family heme chaperone HemW [Lachnospiraceae bacterium]|nr:radical SAM family heme chaperone HemW [Lachnospiraceae bacterium]
MKKPLDLYIHIPFCVRKCDYCDFLSAPADGGTKERYVSQLLEEIRQSVSECGMPAGASMTAASDRFACECEAAPTHSVLPSWDYEVSTVFIGGGTPSILPAGEIGRIMELLRECFAWREQPEITIEVNPGTLSAEKLAAYRNFGINRISLGLQSADDAELQRLGRIHTWEQFLASFRLAREAGFRNINVDLMSALPGQTAADWRRTLEKVLALEPEHISAYSLIIEEGTPFHERYAEHPELLPDEDEERRMYYDTKEILAARGYARYEISNYAKPGNACRHNLGYWERTDYRGYGLGAASLLDNVRSSNTREMEAYLRGEFAGTSEILSEKDIREEYFFLGLRRMEGVDPGPYREHYATLFAKLGEQGLLEESGRYVRLTERGIDVSNYVFAQFLE